MTQNVLVAEPKRGRGRPPIHPLWLDPVTGERRSLRQHPNYDVCRNFLNRAMDSDADAESWLEETGRTYRRFNRSGFDSNYQLVDAWREDIAAFTYGVAEEIGMRPDRYYDLKPIDASKPIGPGNVRWEKRGWANTNRARMAKARRDERRVRTPSGATIPGSVADALVHQPGCESTHVPPIECGCCSGVVQSAESW